MMAAGYSLARDIGALRSQGRLMAGPDTRPISSERVSVQCLSFTGMKLVYYIFLILLALVWYGGMRKWYGKI